MKKSTNWGNTSNTWSEIFITKQQEKNRQASNYELGKEFDGPFIQETIIFLKYSHTSPSKYKIKGTFLCHCTRTECAKHNHRVRENRTLDIPGDFT